MIIEVITTIYSFPYADFLIESASIGDIVSIDIMGKMQFAVVHKIKHHSSFQLKMATYAGYSLSERFIDYIKEFAFYNFIGESFLVKYIVEKLPKKTRRSLLPLSQSKINLFDEQQHAYDIIQNSQHTLLWGITGSGKTEIFFKIIEDNLSKNTQTLILLPEIAITEAISNRFYKTFGFEPVIWHSTSQSSVKFAGIINGDIPVVIGSRSAILIPFKNLSTIIVDEEHDRSYKQEVQPCYNARDMAFLRSKIEGCKSIFASATPSIESFSNCQKGIYSLARVNKRYGEAKLPKITLIPHYAGVLNEKTILKASAYLSKGHQAVFYLNKRGFASFSQCKSCMKTISCLDCDSLLSWHKHNKILLCHQCNRKYPIASCPHCGSYGTVASYGIGVEKLAQILQGHFPDKNTYVASSDFLEKRSQILEFIEKVKNKEIDIIAGTQIISKGHDFPGISLIVLVNFAETGFDFRAAETNMQNLVQIAGRAGRAGTEAEVLIQTAKSDSRAIEFLRANDYEGFLNYELQRRKKWSLPPFCRLVALKSYKFSVITKAYEILKNRFTCYEPNESFMFAKKYYYIVLKMERNKAALYSLKDAIKSLKLTVNVDPYDLYL